MAHWANIDEENVVVNVVVAGDGAHDWLVKNFGGMWLQTSYNAKGGVHYTWERDDDDNRIPSDEQWKAKRYNYASVGGTYNPERDAFIPPKPFEGAILDSETLLWSDPDDV